MSEKEVTLPQRVSHINLDGRDVWLVGTAHVSQQSVEDVQQAIKTVGPDTVCVELCEPRYKALMEHNQWEKMNIFKILKEKKAAFFLAQLVMHSFYLKLGKQLGVTPGAEMLEAISQAKNTKAELVLADRPIAITLKRVWGYLGFWNKMKLMAHLVVDVCVGEKIDEELIEKLKSQDQLESIMADFAKSFPEIKKRLIDERDIYLAQKIRQAQGQKIVAVVGAGHVAGIKEHIQSDESLDALMELPKQSLWPKILKWGIPTAIIGLIMFGFFKDGSAHSVENIYIWILVNGILSAVGAAIALAHPLTIVSAFFGAPITSLNPLIAAGWVAGLVQAWIRTPTVADFEDLPNATSTIKGFWTNPVTKILLVVALANLGSVLGTWIAGSWIAARSF